jgi:hypothetical protein
MSVMFLYVSSFPLPPERDRRSIRDLARWRVNFTVGSIGNAFRGDWSELSNVPRDLVRKGTVVWRANSGSYRRATRQQNNGMRGTVRERISDESRFMEPT